MGVLLQYIWGVKVILTGWSAYKACTGEYANPFICGLSTSYFVVLAIASCWTFKRMPTPREIDGMENQYLRDLEEGVFSGRMNVKIKGK